MVCPECQRRAALIALLAPTISRLTFSRHGLLRLLGLPEGELIQAAKVGDPEESSRSLERKVSRRSKRVPTALCRHDARYPEALAQLDSAPAVLHATCTIERLRELLTGPTVVMLGGREHTRCAQQLTFGLAHDLAAAGVTVISGLDTGLEGIAHRGALDARGHTIAVMPCGPEIPYPSMQEELHLRILSRAPRSRSSHRVSSLRSAGA